MTGNGLRDKDISQVEKALSFRKKKKKSNQLLEMEWDRSIKTITLPELPNYM